MPSLKQVASWELLLGLVYPTLRLTYYVFWSECVQGFSWEVGVPNKLGASPFEMDTGPHLFVLLQIDNSASTTIHI